MSSGHHQRSDLRSRRPVICHPVTRPRLNKKTSVLRVLLEIVHLELRKVEVSTLARGGAKPRGEDARPGSEQGDGLLRRRGGQDGTGAAS